MNHSILHIYHANLAVDIDFYVKQYKKGDQLVVIGVLDKQTQQFLQAELSAVIFCDENDYSELLELMPKHAKTWSWK